jgi:hypothetical protein
MNACVPRTWPSCGHTTVIAIRTLLWLLVARSVGISRFTSRPGALQKDATPAARKGAANRRFTYKFSFVLDTEDAMCTRAVRRRRDPARHESVRQAQVARFHARMDQLRLRKSPYLAAMEAMQAAEREGHHFRLV